MRKFPNYRDASLLTPKRTHIIAVRFPDRIRKVELLNFAGGGASQGPKKVTVSVPLSERAGLQTQYGNQIYLEQTLGTGTGQVVYTLPFKKVLRTYQNELLHIWNLQQAK